jgi:glycolate oxidase FAD binding subunit
MATAAQAIPRTFDAAARMLAQASAKRRSVRFRGAGTKLDWGRPPRPADVELSTMRLNRVVEHNVGDLTAIMQAGVPLADAQRTFAAAGQMLALDPPLRGSAPPVAGYGDQPTAGATIGGIAATADSGPLRHRYGAPRDLIVGATIALSDGTIAKSGGKVIKNVAGYDLAKLFAGSFGTLGLILSVSVRLHPLPPDATTTLGVAADPALLGRAAIALAAAPLEFEALDVRWHDEEGAILARCAGTEHARRARRAARLMEGLGLGEVEVTGDDEPLWERQRAGQRAHDRGRAVVRVAAAPTELPAVLRATNDCGGTLVGRAALGISYVELVPEALRQLRALAPPGASAILQDAPAAIRAQHDPWGALEPTTLELMRSVKARFDPTRTCNSGLFVGGI